MITYGEREKAGNHVVRMEVCQLYACAEMVYLCNNISDVSYLVT